MSFCVFERLRYMRSARPVYRFHLLFSIALSHSVSVHIRSLVLASSLLFSVVLCVGLCLSLFSIVFLASFVSHC